jgi:Ala-tRNA(Pro) deacylase
MTLSRTLEIYLDNHGTEYELEHHALSLSSLGNAKAAQIDEHSLAKSVLLEDDEGPLLAVLTAAGRLDLASVCEQVGRDLHFAQEKETERFFPDCAFGALPVLGGAYGLPMVMDQSLESLEEVYFEAGDHETLVRMRGSDFIGLMRGVTRGRIATESETWIISRRARERLHGSLSALKDAIAAPRASGDRWRRRLRHELSGVQQALAGHVAQSESPDGLLRQIEGQAPHLSRSVDCLRTDHVELEARVVALLGEVDAAYSASALRDSVLDLLHEFERHRHRGADLVYEAYGVDIGGG